ncbi:MAG: CARDB domain-containing protein, partial [Pseudooceanicola atlanticus]
SLVEAVIDHHRDLRRYTFTLDSAAKLMMDSQFDGSSAARFRLLDDQGNVLVEEPADLNSASQFLSLQAGDYALELFFSNDTAGTIPFVLRDVTDAPLLDLDTMVTVPVMPARGSAVYRTTLDGSAPLQLAHRTPVGNNFTLRLLDQHGREVHATSGTDVSIPQMGLSGTYYVVVEGYQTGSATEAGSLDIGLFQRTETTRDVTLGTRIDGTLSQPGDRHRLRFELAQDTWLQVDSLIGSGVISWAVETANGDQLASRDFDDMPWGREELLRLSAGRYDIVIRGDDGATGDYALALRDLDAAPSLPRDTDVTLNLEAEGSQAFAFDVAAGDLLRLEPGSLSALGVSTSSLIVQVFDAVGHEIHRGNFVATDLGPAKYSGRYSLLINASHSVVDAVTPILRLADQGSAPTIPMSGDPAVLGEVITGQIDTPDGSEQRLFTLTETTRLLLDSQSNNANIWVRVDGPHGAITEAYRLSSGVTYAGLGSTNPAVLTLQPGTYALTFYATSGAVGGYALGLIDADASATAITDGTPVEAVIDPGNALKTFSFTGQAGDRVMLSDVTVTGGGSSAGTFQLIDPDGFVATFEGNRASVSLSDTFPATLPKSGTYLLRIAGGMTSPAFSVDFTLRQDRVRTQALTLGDLVSASLDTKLSQENYTFSLASDTALFLSAMGTDAQIQWRLRSAETGELLRSSPNLNGINNTGEAMIWASAGDYVLEIHSDSYRTRGDYVFSLTDLFAAPQATDLDAVTLDAQPTPQITTTSVTLEAGKRYYFDTVSTSTASFWMQMGLVSPSGRLLSIDSISNDIGAIEALESGQYTLFIWMNRTLDTPAGTVTLAVREPVRSFVDSPLNQTISGEIEGAGDSVVHRFTLPKAGYYYFDSQTGSSTLEWALRRNGVTEQSGRLNSDSGVNTSYLLAAGDYEVVITGRDSNVGEYRFGLIDLGAAPLLPADGHVEDTLVPGAALRAYRIPVVAGDVLSIDVDSVSGSATRRLISPTGQQIVQGYFGYDTDRAKLTETGECLLLLGGASGTLSETRYAFDYTTLRAPTPIDIGKSDTGADLGITGLTTDGPVRANSPVTIRWTLTNSGDQPSQDGLDRIVIRNPDRSAILAVVEVPQGGPLAAGASRAREAVVQLPGGLPGTGELTISVFADALNATREPGAEGGEATITVTSTPETLADLVVEDITFTPAVNWQPGDDVTISWTLRNQGGAPASEAFVDQLRLRNRSTGAELALIDVGYDGPAIAPGDTVARSATVTWPGGQNQIGQFTAIVTTDTGNTVDELNTDGDAETNNTATVDVVSAPDIIAENLRVLTENPQAGGQVTIAYDVVNIGNGATRFGWTDRINIYNQALFATAHNSIVDHGGPMLAPGERVTRQVTVTLADGVAGTGELRLLVQTNRDEFGRRGMLELTPDGSGGYETGTVVTFQSAARSYPDLRVRDLDVADNALSGQSLAIGWRVENGGVRTDVSSWVDRVVLSGDTIIGNGDDVILAEIPRDGALDPDGFYDVATEVDLPSGLTGTYRIAVIADVGSDVTEPDTRGDNTALSEIGLTAPISDLKVEIVTAPPAAGYGDSVALEWRVRNLGVDPATGSWTDAVYVSTDAVLDGNDILLGEVARTGPLAAGDSYTVTGSFDLTGALTGPVHFLIVTDRDDTVFEGADEANNVTATIGQTTLTVGPAADLTVASVTAPKTASPGREAVIRWSVRNDGAGIARSPWVDNVYLSTDGALDGAQLIGSVVRSFDLDVGESYQGELTLPFPDIAPGGYTVLVLTDAANRVFEAGDAPNLAASDDRVAVDSPDLRVTALEAVGQVTSGQTIDIDVTFANTGPGTAQADRRDVIVLSLDDVFDDSDVVLAEWQRTETLEPGAIIEDRVTVTIPIEVFGDFNLLAVSDADGNVIEANPDNNATARALRADLAPHADLVVRDVEAPEFTARDPATITVSWRVEN